ncbi:MAG: right-handed parallel beta-helix repeat-containing protein, partial [Myxococcota bacterium]
AVSDLARAVDRGSLYYQNTSGLDGGAIAGLGIAILDVTDSNFTLNRTQRRGGAVVGYSVASVARCAFARNSATSRVSPTEGLGGAVYLANGTIESSVFSGNRGQSGGAVATEGSIEVSDCVFENNIADEEGGAVSRRVAVERSTFRNNTAEESGGAAVLTADFFRNNLCDNNAGRQGGCLFMPQSSASVQVSTNTMTRNVGAFGGANVYVPITNCRTIDILRSYFGGGDAGVENDCPSADQSLTVETVDSPWPLCRDMPTQPDCVGSTLDP